MCIDKDLTLLLIKRKYGSINRFLSELPATRALFYQALSLDRPPIHKESKTRDILDRLDAEGLLAKSDSDFVKQLKQVC